MRKLLLSTCCIALFLAIGVNWAAAQSTSDGPIRLRVRVAQVYARDFEDLVDNAENTWLVWARDQTNLDGLDWRGGNCIQENPSPGSYPFTSGNRNITILDHTYGTTVPGAYQVRLDAWEDDCGNRCGFDNSTFSCFGDTDDARCNQQNFTGNIGFRGGLPGRWNNDGWFDACGGQYRVRMESFWNYTRGNTTSNPIDIGTINCSPTSYSHVNANTDPYTNTRDNGSRDVFYRFVIQQTSNISLTTCNATTNFDTYLRLLNSGGGQLAANDDASCGFGSTRSTLNFNNLAPGTYFILVEGFSNSEGQFQLDVNITPTAQSISISGLPANMCVDDAAVTMTGSPSGGIFSGNGVSGSQFFPSASGVGTHTVTYTVDYSVNSIGWPGFHVGGTSIGLGDDQGSGAINMPFTFEFYGVGYNQFYISSNGFISFTNSNVASRANVPVRNGGTPNNYIAGAWDDLNPATGGTIGYDFIGSAPNRQAIITFHNVNHYNTGPASVTFQIVLYEANQYVEIRSINIQTDGGTMTQGIENNNGSLGVAVPGRNSASFTAVSSAYQFRPPGGCGFSVDQQVTVNPLPDANFSLPGSICISADPITLTPTQSGGTFSGPGVSGNSFNPALAGTGNKSITYNITSSAGCTSSSTRQINVLSAPTASISSSNEGCPGANDGSATASGSGGAGGYAYAWSTGANTATISNLAPGGYSVTVTDGNGCTGTASVTIAAGVDNTNPVISNCPGNITINTPANGCTQTATWTAPTASDNCAVSSFTSTHNSGASFPLGTTTVTYTATDPSNNAATCSFTVTVVDNVDPVVTCPGNQTLNLDATCNATLPDYTSLASATDNCTAGLTIVQSPAPGTAVSGVGSNVAVTLSATDAANNSGFCTFSVNLQDNTNPVARCQNISVYLGSNGQASITAADVDNGSSDNCGTPTLSVSPSTFDCNSLGAQTVTLTATDASNNTHSCTATVTVLDSVSPVPQCRNISINLDASGSATIQPQDVDNGSSDNCSILTLSLNRTSFGCGDVGTQTVTLTATDGSGRSASCQAQVTVNDNSNPTANCRPSQTIYLNGTGQVNITTADIDLGSTDPCGIANVSISPASFTCSDLGANTVTLTVRDNNNNTSTCTSTVTVLDTTAPNPNCNAVSLYLDGNGNASLTAAALNNNSFDNCGVTTVSASKTSFDCSDLGANTVALTVGDGSGNSASCNATVTVLDTLAPVARCRNITVALDASGSATIQGSDVNDNSSDNCSIAGLSVSPSSFNCSNFGANTVTLTVQDGAGNQATCQATVTIIDNTAPVPNCQPVTVYLDQSGNAMLTATAVNNNSTDNCGIDSLRISRSNFTCTDLGPNTVTLTVRDASGNQATCQTTVTVADTSSPNAQCAPVVTAYLDSSGTTTITASDVDNNSSSLCSVSNRSLSQSSFTCGDLGINTVTLNVTAAGGGVSSCTTQVNILDTIPPNVICQNIVLQLDSNGQALLTPQALDGGTTDNCSIDSMWLSLSSFGCADRGVQTVTLFVRDAGGNVASNTGQVDVQNTNNRFCNEVPTVSEWGLIVLLLLMLNMGAIAMYRIRRSGVASVPGLLERDQKNEVG